MKAALRLRCPQCGVGPLMRSWFRLAEACPHCGLRFERDGEEGYWLGAYLLNFIVTEVLCALVLGLVVVATWPVPAWATVIVMGVILTSLTPIAFYPFAKALWLAIDLVFDPVRPEDFHA